jgi:voltage-gated potassium channel Kch
MKSLWRRSGLTCLALVVFYFAVPVKPTAEHKTEIAVRVLITVLAMAALVYGIQRQLRRQLARPDAPLGGLVVGVVAGTLASALIDYGIAVHSPGEFIGLSSRIDALYFALATLFTVGFGDITAAGQFARAVLCVQMLFNVIVIATVASYIVREAGSRVRARRSHGP